MEVSLLAISLMRQTIDVLVLWKHVSDANMSMYYIQKQIDDSIYLHQTDKMHL
jgi:hypothetical protein